MPIRKSKRNVGISRIDQPHKRTHGFFVRLTRQGVVHNAFFADKSHGGKKKALEAAREHYAMLLRKHGGGSRRDRAEIVRRLSSSGIVGVRKTVVVKKGRKDVYWMASWSPKLNVVRRRMFAVRKYGAEKAKALAIRTRRAGVRAMED